MTIGIEEHTLNHDGLF